MTQAPNKTAIALPSATIQVPGVIKAQHHEWLEKNHEQYDIFFNPRGFHNHMVHQYLSAYTLGATPERLHEIYEEHASYQRPLPPSVGEVTRDNYREYLANRGAYTSVLRFFQKEVDMLGMEEAVRYWIFKDDMLARLVGGAIHPLIHLGYAFEFGLPYVAAEALAAAVCAQSYIARFLPQDADAKKEPGEHKLLDLVQSIRADLPGISKYSDEDKVMKVVDSDKAAQKIREAIALWDVHENNVEAKLKELYVSIMLLYSGSAVRGDKVRLDFFLAHALTSVYAAFRTVPHLTRAQAASLIQAHLAASLVWFLSRGGPAADVDAVLQYQSTAPSNAQNPWFDVLDRSLGHHEAHVIKVVRACAVGQMAYGNEYPEAWLKTAQMTLDHAGGHLPRGGWIFDGVGYDEVWK